MSEPIFAARLTSLRQTAGLTQYRLAQLSGIGRQFIAELERNEKRPGWDTVCKLADALKVSMDAFR